MSTAFVTWLSSEDRTMQHFYARLASDLERAGYDYMAATPGRDANHRLFWRVTARHPQHGVLNFQALFDADVDAYAISTCALLVERIVAVAQVLAR